MSYKLCSDISVTASNVEIKSAFKCYHKIHILNSIHSKSHKNVEYPEELQT